MRSFRILQRYIQCNLLGINIDFGGKVSELGEYQGALLYILYISDYDLLHYFQGEEQFGIDWEGPVPQESNCIDTVKVPDTPLLLNSGTCWKN